MVENMVVQDPSLTFQSEDQTITIQANKNFRAKLIDKDKYVSALSTSLENAKLFDVVTKDQEYELIAEMNHWFQPPASTTFHSDFRVNYILKKDGNIVFEKEIETNGVATVKEAFVGSKRAIMSMERAIQANIRTFIEEVSKVEL
jgi:preprotein translocase subunit SecB